MNINSELRSQLRLLCHMRAIFLCILAASGFFFVSLDQLKQIPWIAGTMVMAALLTVLAYWRSRAKHHIDERELFMHLLGDIVSVSLLIYVSAGVNNPFISYLLVPICVGASALKAPFTATLCGFAVLSYSLLYTFYLPIPELMQSHQGLHANHNKANLHLFGMWFSFCVSALLISYFVGKIASSLRQQQALIQTHQENLLRDEQIVAVATLAAGTSHELATPISTMKMLVEDLQQSQFDPKQSQTDLECLSNQIDHCRDILNNISQRSHLDALLHVDSYDFLAWFNKIIKQLNLMRPQAKFDIRSQLHASIASQFNLNIEQAITSILNNAIDAHRSDSAIIIDLSQQQNWIIIEVHNIGGGIASDIREQLGQAFVSSKGEGRGLGLFLSHASINRIGGTITLADHVLANGDIETLTTINLPVNADEL